MMPRPHTDARWVMHLVLTCVMGLIAVQLWLPTRTFESGANWHAIEALMSEDHCATLCAVVSAVGWAGVVLRRTWVLVASSAVLATAHGLMAFSFVYSNPSGIGAVLLSGFAAEGYYMAYRRARGGV